MQEDLAESGLIIDEENGEEARIHVHRSISRKNIKWDDVILPAYAGRRKGRDRSIPVRKRELIKCIYTVEKSNLTDESGQRAVPGAGRRGVTPGHSCSGRKTGELQPLPYGTATRGIGLFFVNICPKCGRRYPASIRNCLECGTRLVNNKDEETKKRALAIVRKIGIISLTGGFLFCAFLFIIPLLNLSVVAGQDVSTIVTQVQAPQAPAIPTYTLNQTARSADLEVTVLRTREGTNVLNANRFFFVTVNLHNIRHDTRIQVAGSDFILTDAQGHTYYTYGLGNSIAQDVPPQASQSYELEYEIPRGAGGLVLAVWFPQDTPGSAAEPPARFAVS
jgi:ribosomal protein L40E